MIPELDYDRGKLEQRRRWYQSVRQVYEEAMEQGDSKSNLLTRNLVNVLVEIEENAHELLKKGVSNYLGRKDDGD